MAVVGGGLLLVVCDAAPGQEEELERWYEHQHLYERSAIDGFYYSRRYISLRGEPKSLALYEIEAPEILHNEAYLGAMRREHEARAAQSASPPPGRSANQIRNEYRLLDSTGRHPGELGAFVWLVRDEADAAHDADLLAWYRNDLFSSIAAISGVRGIKLYEATAGAPKYLSVYELSTGDVVDSEAWRRAFASAAGERLRPHLRDVTTNLGQFWKVVYQDEARRETASWPGGVYSLARDASSVRS